MKKRGINNFRKSYSFNIDSLEKTITYNFSYTKKVNKRYIDNGCFIFSLDSGKLSLDESARNINNSLPQDFSAKFNVLKTVILIERGVQVIGTSTTDGKQFTKIAVQYAMLYFYDCTQNSIIWGYNHKLYGSEIPESVADVKKIETISHSPVADSAIVNYITSMLKMQSKFATDDYKNLQKDTVQKPTNGKRVGIHTDEPEKKKGLLKKIFGNKDKQQ